METLFCKCEDCGISVGLAEGQHRDHQASARIVLLSAILRKYKSFQASPVTRAFQHLAI